MDSNKKQAENKSKKDDDEAATALMELLTLDRSTPMETLQELVGRVAQSPQHAHLLPLVICYLRNHGKSLAPGTGSGERDVAERLTVALYNVDREAGLMMLRFLVAYGSWKSLLNVLVLCDRLLNAEQGAAAEARREVPPLTAAKGVSPPVPAPPSDKRPRRSAAKEGPHVDLCQKIHELFTKQLRADQDAVDAAANAPGEAAVVSNASKFAPHEHRGRNLTSAHADSIAAKLFPDEAEAAPGNDETKKKNNDDVGRGRQRRLYRHLRSRLNEANRHLPDRYLAMGRAGELDVSNITAGYMAKSRKGLLNIPIKKEDKLANKKMRYDDEARIDLRERILKAAVNPHRVPAPSDLAELASGLLGVVNDADADDGERTVLESTYLRAVIELAKRVKERRADVLQLLNALSLPEDFPVQDHPSDILVAVDVSPSQSYTFPVVALLVLLFNDTLDALDEEKSTSEKDESIVTEEDNTNEVDNKPTARRCIMFHQSSTTLALPLSRSAPASERLAALVKSFRSARLTEDGKEGNDYADLVKRLGREIADRQHPPSTVAVVVCSDFCSSPEFAAAVEEHFGGSANEVCCWRMSVPKRERLREISWDPNRPQIDICFVLDTTGSMGSYIQHCVQEIQQLLRQLTEVTVMPVACSFVSYKDFGDDGHLEVHPWVNVNDDMQIGSLRDFVGRLAASGGGDIEEDVAGGLEKALELMKQRQATPSMKLVLLLADAGGHGYPSGRPKHGGVDQKERLKKVVKSLVAKRELGCELMLARITSHTDMTCEAIDSWLQEDHTFIDQIEMGHASSTVFRDKIVASLQQVVAHAVAPAAAKGLDVYGGTDFGICASLINMRLANYASRLAEKLSKDKKVKETEEGGEMDLGGEEPEEEDEEEEEYTRAEMPTAFGNLVGKLSSDDYNMVREAMGALKCGIYAEYEAPPDHTLSKASVAALLQAGLTVKDLVEGGYPDRIIAMFEQEIQTRLSHGAGRKG